MNRSSDETTQKMINDFARRMKAKTLQHQQALTIAAQSALEIDIKALYRPPRLSWLALLRRSPRCIVGHIGRWKRRGVTPPGAGRGEMVSLAERAGEPNVVIDAAWRVVDSNEQQ